MLKALVLAADLVRNSQAMKAAGVDKEKIFTTSVYGSGNTVIVGSHDVQAVTNQKDDIEGLIETIAKLGYGRKEIDELRKAVEDKAAAKSLDGGEGRTASWLGKATNEAGRGVVKVGVSVAAKVITSALQHFAASKRVRC